MLEVLKERIQEGKVRYKIPTTTQELIPIQAVYGASGIFLVDNRYTKSFKFTDLNYMVSSYENRTDICVKWSEIINTLDHEAITKITVYNRPIDPKDLDVGLYLDSERYPENKMLVQASYDFNKIIDTKTEKVRGTLQDKYITVAIKRDNITEAERFFERLYDDLKSALEEMGSSLQEIDSKERLFILHSFFHQGDEYRPDIDPTSPYFGNDFKNYVAPTHIKRKRDHLIIDDDKYVRSLYLISWANVLRDSFISTLTDISNRMLLSIDIIPVPVDEAERLLRAKSDSADAKIQDWKERQKDITVVPPPQKLNDQAACREWDDDIHNNDERMLTACITMVITADSKEELDKITGSLKKAVKSSSGTNAQLDIATQQQFDVFNTCLPYGTWRVKQMRLLNTSSLSVLTPFKCIDLLERNGVHIGENKISRNFVVPNFENLINQSAVMVGKPGGGKSMLIKWIQLQRIMKTDNKYIIVDPEGEYSVLYQYLCPELVSVINLGSGRDKINCMEMVKNYGTDENSNPISIKSQFVMTLLNQADPDHPITLEERSILDRCVRMTYENYSDTGEMPTLRVLHRIIAQQEEVEARHLALKLEMFTTGSFNTYAEESTVDMYGKRITIFNLFGLREIEKPIALFVLTDAVINMVTLNWESGGSTYIDFDEAQVLLSNPSTATFFDNAYRQWRKRSGMPNAISQNAKCFMTNEVTTNMLANSEVTFMTSQAEVDLLALKEFYNLSEENTKWLDKSEKGAGLLKYGDLYIPFSNVIPENTLIYKLFSTKKNEGIFGNEDYRSPKKI